MDTVKFWHTSIFYISAFLQGIALITFPAAGFILANPVYHRLSPSEFGAIFLPMIAGMISSSIISSRLAGKRGLRSVYLTGLLLNAASLLLMALTSLLYSFKHELLFLLTLSLFLLGAGFGTTFTSLNIYISRYFPWRTPSAMNALYMCFGIGSTLSPQFLLIAMAAFEHWWLDPLCQMFIYLFLAAVAAMVLPLQPPSQISLETSQKEITQTAPRVPLKLYLTAVFLYGVCETIFGNTATIYLHSIKGLSFHMAALGLTLFWGMVTIGRGAISLLSYCLSPLRIYVILPWIIAIAFALLPLSEASALSLFAFALAGIGCSACFPLNVAFAEKDFAKKSPLISGALMACFALGYGLGAYGVGILRESKQYSLDSIYEGGILLALLMAFVFGRIFVYRRDIHL